jgi:hypothetical protein
VVDAEATGGRRKGREGEGKMKRREGRKPGMLKDEGN